MSEILSLDVPATASSYIRQFHGKSIVVKLGGAALDDSDAAGDRSLAQDLLLLRSVGVRVVLVHGGGPAAFPAYVKLWTSYGFAVLAMVWYNQRPVIVDPTREGESQLERQPLPGGRRQDHVANVANMVFHQAVPVDLPQVDATRIDDKPQVLAVAIDADGKVFVDGVVQHRSALPEVFAAAVVNGREPELHLRADQTVPYRAVAETLADASKAGVSKISFVTDPGPVAPATAASR